jgi:hypothetical protein
MATAPNAHAIENEETSTARELARLGFLAFDEGRYQEATDKTLEAFQIVRMPTLLVKAARALEKLKRYTEAVQQYQRALELTPLENWQSVQHEARAEAQLEVDRLLSRFGRLRIQVEGDENPIGPIVSVGTTEVPPALRMNYLVDPGRHVIRCRCADKNSVEQVVEVEGGEQRVVQLRCGSVANVPGSGTNASNIRQQANQSAPPQQVESRRTALVATGIGAMGLGIAGVVVGIVAHTRAKTMRSDLLATGRCSSDGLHCDPSLSGQVDSYMLTRTLSTVAVVAGATVMAGGATVLLWRARRAPVRLGLMVGVGQVAIQGWM